MFIPIVLSLTWKPVQFDIKYLSQYLLQMRSLLLLSAARRNHAVSFELLRNSFRTIRCSAISHQQDSSGERREVPPKPDLKKAARNNRPVQVIAATCVLVLIYMYPMILKPLFGLGEESVDKQKDRIKQMGIELDKHRPSNMPEWSSPFAPRSDDK